MLCQRTVFEIKVAARELVFHFLGTRLPKFVAHSMLHTDAEQQRWELARERTYGVVELDECDETPSIR